MKKIKKIFDFEIVTILTIIILILPFYLLMLYATTTEDISGKEVFEISGYKYSLEFNKLVNNEAHEKQDLFKLQITDFDDNLLYISSSDVELIGLLVGLVTIIVNIVAIIICIIMYLIKSIILSRNRKYLEDSDFENISIPNYNIAVANTLYTGRIGFNKLYNFFRIQFEEKGLIDKKGNIDSNVNIKNLSELEQMFITLYRTEIKDETQREFKEKIVKELESRGYLEESKFKSYIDYACEKVEKVGRWLYKKDKDDPIRIALETTIPFVVLILIATFKNLSIILFIAIAYIQLKYFNIFLTKEGKREKAKICLLINELKEKEELTEKEKIFYDALKYINL